MIRCSKKLKKLIEKYERNKLLVLLQTQAKQKTGKKRKQTEQGIKKDTSCISFSFSKQNKFRVVSTPKEITQVPYLY